MSRFIHSDDDIDRVEFVAFHLMGHGKHGGIDADAAFSQCLNGLGCHGTDVSTVGSHVETSRGHLHCIGALMLGDEIPEQKFREAAAEVIAGAKKENALHR